MEDIRIYLLTSTPLFHPSSVPVICLSQSRPSGIEEQIHSTGQADASEKSRCPLNIPKRSRLQENNSPCFPSIQVSLLGLLLHQQATHFRGLPKRSMKDRFPR
jgi:hypothetical protein